MKELRQSVNPVWNSNTGHLAYEITTYENGAKLSTRKIEDPFVRHKITIPWIQLICHLLRFRKLELIVSVSGLPHVQEAVLELNADYLGAQNSTRRHSWNQSVENSLSAIGEENK